MRLVVGMANALDEASLASIAIEVRVRQSVCGRNELQYRPSVFPAQDRADGSAGRRAGNTCKQAVYRSRGITAGAAEKPAVERFMSVTGG